MIRADIRDHQSAEPLRIGAVLQAKPAPLERLTLDGKSYVVQEVEHVILRGEDEHMLIIYVTVDERPSGPVAG